jgi:hypothetical protein
MRYPEAFRPYVNIIWVLLVSFRSIENSGDSYIKTSLGVYRLEIVRKSHACMEGCIKDPQMLLLRLRGGVRMGTMVKNNDVSEIPSELYRRLDEAIKGGLDSEMWTDDSSARDRFQR